MVLLSVTSSYFYYRNVFLFGAPVTGNASEWEGLSHLISGRIVNCLSKNDWVLKLMVRGAGAEFCVAGLDGINLPREYNILSW
jgi:hypothetical protein